MEDPYNVVQQEIQSSLQTAATLRSSYLRIRSMARPGVPESEEHVYARNELKATLAALEADWEDLEESVKIVEVASDPRLFGLSAEQVLQRRRYCNRIHGELASMRAEVSSNDPQQSRDAHGALSPYRPTSPYSEMANSPRDASGFLSPRMSPLPASPAAPHSPRTPRVEEEEDHQGQWAREEQQMMMRQQDSALDGIAHTLSSLATQAGLMGAEIGEHVELLNDLEQGVERTDTKLSGAMRKMRKFVRQTEEKRSGWCIAILIVILLVLLTLVILL